MVTRIYVVERSHAVRARLASAIAEHGDAELAGTAQSEDEAIHGILACSPDIVILDLHIGNGSGLKVLETIRARGCRATVIVQTDFASPGYRERCLRNGADHFLDKTTETPRLFELIRSGAASAG